MLVLLILLSVQGAGATEITSGGNDALLSCGCGGGGGGGGGGSGGILTQAEIDGLNYMREEEKLARDAYLTLYAKWGLPIFSNIASSEVRHMSKVKDLLDRYGLPDPAAGNAIGEFTDPFLQQLYDDLMVQGSQSSIEALKVGVAIEEVDIADLQRYLETTNRTDITRVYTNLMNASYMHLSAFNSQLGQ
jgi:hypothetical protein